MSAGTACLRCRLPWLRIRLCPAGVSGGSPAPGFHQGCSEAVYQAARRHAAASGTEAAARAVAAGAPGGAPDFGWQRPCRRGAGVARQRPENGDGAVWWLRFSATSSGACWGGYLPIGVCTAFWANHSLMLGNWLAGACCDWQLLVCSVGLIIGETPATSNKSGSFCNQCATAFHVNAGKWTTA